MKLTKRITQVGNETSEYSIPKELWGDGPWQTEPDIILWTDAATQYPCVIWRNKQTGSLCGYVGVPSSHPDSGRDYDDVDVDVHGGLTFADLAKPDEALSHLSGIWLFGFDCCHWDDEMPATAALMRRHNLGPISDDSVSYKGVPYVRAEVTSLARQLKERDNWKSRLGLKIKPTLEQVQRYLNLPQR